MDSFEEFLREVTPHNIQHQVSILKKQSVLWSEDTLVQIVNCIFEKVSAEPSDLIYLYVYTCKMMLEFEVKKIGSNTKVTTVTFEDVMQSRAGFRLTEILMKQEKGKQMKSKAGKEAGNGLGVVCSFLSQLFVQDVLSSDTLLFCIHALMAHNTEITWQCLSKILKNSLVHLESLGTSHLFKRVFQRIYEKIQGKHFSIQTRFMLCDLNDMRVKNKETVEAQFHTFDKIRRDANTKVETAHRNEQRQRDHGQVPSNSSGLPSPLASPGAWRTSPHDMNKQGVCHSCQQLMSVNHRQSLLLPQYRMQPQAGQMHSMKVSFTEQPVERVSQNTPKEGMKIGNFQRDLTLQFQNESLTNGAVFDFIEKSIPPDVRKTKEFIRALVSAVCFGTVKGEGTNSRGDHELLKKRSVLMQRYIDSDAKLELQALFAVQHLNYSLENPPGLLRLYFDILFDEDVVSEETFYSWRESEDAAEKTGKVIALKSVTSFYTWLENSDTPN